MMNDTFNLCARLMTSLVIQLKVIHILVIDVCQGRFNIYFAVIFSCYLNVIRSADTQIVVFNRHMDKISCFSMV